MTSSPSLLSGRQKCHGGFTAIFAMLFATVLSQVAAAIPLQTPGNFDPLFAGGLGKIASLSISAGNDHANAVVLQPHGKFLLAGYCYTVSDYDFCVARLNVDGTLDATFVEPAGNGNGKFLLPISTGGSKDDVLTAMALQGNGKIVLAGYCVSSGNNNQFCAARLNADGSLDTNFDGPGVIPGDGKFLLTMGAFSTLATALLVQPDGNIAMTGYCAITASNADFCAARLLPGTARLIRA